jgi:glutathione S-transferase
MLQLLGRPTSINVRKVQWLCDELALRYTLQSWGAGVRDTGTPEFLALNPNGLVPVLVEPAAGGDFVLWESNTICRYLAARAQRQDLLPAAPRERACVEQWMDWQAGELNNAWRYAFMHLVRKNPAFADAQAAQASVGQWNRHMAMLDAQLARSGAFVAGEHFTLADIVIGLATARWLMAPIERSELPAVAAYVERLKMRPAFTAHALNGVP